MNISISRALAATLLAGLVIAPLSPRAQGFSPFGRGQGQGQGQGQVKPTPSPQADGRTPPGFAQQPPRIGFDAPPAPQAAEPPRQNFADELTDFGAPPQTAMQANVGSETPTSVPGGHVITTNEMRQAVGSDIIFIDVWDAPQHPSLPGAIPMPDAGRPGSFDDETQQRLWNALSQVTNRRPDRPIVFFCTGSRCWESYNAALRAINMGFKMVLWYRGGLAAWQASGGQMTGGQTQAGVPPRRGGIGFGQQ